MDANDSDLVYFEMQDGRMGRRNLRTGAISFFNPQPPKGASFRFNWNTPFILSSHNSHIYYAAGNYVLRSLKRGDDLRVISPEITLTRRGTATALAESPLNPDVLYVGRPAGAQPESTVELYRLAPGSDTAQRTRVALGRSSVNTIEVKSGLSEGDRVVLSDMSAWDTSETVRLR